MSLTMWILVGAALIALFAWLLRRISTDSGAVVPPPFDAGEEPHAATGGQGMDAPDAGEEPDDLDEVPDGLIAVTSDGLAFVPQAHHVLVTAADDVRDLIARQRAEYGGEKPETGARVFEAVSDPRPTIHLRPGDLIATRIRRGAPDLDPWRLETLGRDRDLSVWIFEVPEAAEAAREMLERRIVQPPRDEHGDSIAVGDEDFWVAERELERTLKELDAPEPLDDDEGRPR